MPFLLRAVSHTDGSDNENHHCLLHKAQAIHGKAPGLRLGDFILATPTAQRVVIHFRLD